MRQIHKEQVVPMEQAMVIPPHTLSTKHNIRLFWIADFEIEILLHPFLYATKEICQSQGKPGIQEMCF